MGVLLVMYAMFHCKLWSIIFVDVAYVYEWTSRSLLVLYQHCYAFTRYTHSRSELIGKQPFNLIFSPFSSGAFSLDWILICLWVNCHPEICEKNYKNLLCAGGSRHYRLRYILDVDCRCVDLFIWTVNKKKKTKFLFILFDTLCCCCFFIYLFFSLIFFFLILNIKFLILSKPRIFI